MSVPYFLDLIHQTHEISDLTLFVIVLDSGLSSTMTSTRIIEQLNQFRAARAAGGGGDPPSDDERIGGPGDEHSSRRRRAPDPNTSKVKRALFGPVDHEENMK